ncbi:hypothetical protein [Deinococcus sp. UYEF24]
MNRLTPSLALVLLGLPTALAASTTGTPIRQLMSGSGGQMTVSDDVFMVSKRTSVGSTLILGIGKQRSDNNRISGLTVLAFSDYLNASEEDLFEKNVVRVGLACFNLLPQRSTVIAQWLRLQNKGGLRQANSTFGPMNLHFERSVSSGGQVFTGVTMTRSGTPGETPWTKFCSP